MHIQHINDNYPLINLDSDVLKAEMMSVRALMGDTAGDLTALRRRTIESLAIKAGYPPDEGECHSAGLTKPLVRWLCW